MLNAIIDKLQATWPVNRLVLLLTLPVAAGAAVASPWLAAHFPGLPTFSTGELTAFGLAGAATVLTVAYKFIDGWQAHESAKHALERAIAEASSPFIAIDGVDQLRSLELPTIHQPTGQDPASVPKSPEHGGVSPQL